MKKEILIPATRFADPTVDFAFKRIFGTEKYKDATINLLNGLIPELRISDISFINTELIGESQDSKKSVIDIRAKDDDGKEFIIEMQKASQKHFRERSLFYASKVVSLLGQVGSSEYEIPPVYFVSFLNFSMKELGVGTDDGRYMLHYSTCDQQSGEKLPCGPEYYFYCLADYKKKKGPLTVQEKWIYLLQNSKTFREVPEEYGSDKTFGTYFEASNRASFTKAEEDQYTRDMMTQRDIENSKREACERAMADGIKKGKAEGAAEKSREMAKKMKDANIGLDVISECSGLSIEEINEL